MGFLLLRRLGKKEKEKKKHGGQIFEAVLQEEKYMVYKVFLKGYDCSNSCVTNG